ncbi:MAG: MerC domain-containing protein [Verrucomicrobia bacterium]|nr:MerC domain-containing protein [Verrucomicrobiota bacterium]
MNTTLAIHWNQRLSRLDVMGSVLSTLCAIHCLAMPLVAGLLPVLGLGFLGDRAFDRAACVAMMALAALCLAWGCRVHRRWWLFGLLGSGAALTLGTQFVLAPETCAKSCCAGAVNWTQALVMFTGGGAIAAAHLLNLRFRRACRCCAEASTPLAVPGGVRAGTSRETPRHRTACPTSNPSPTTIFISDKSEFRTNP